MYLKVVFAASYIKFTFILTAYTGCKECLWFLDGKEKKQCVVLK